MKMASHPMVDSASTPLETDSKIIIVSCRSGTPLARKISAAYNSSYKDDSIVMLENVDDKFSDSETIVRLDADVSGGHVFLIQAIYDPSVKRTVDENYMAFFIAARACREWGANRVTAILPYLAYSRQDKPAPHKKEPTTAKLTADFAVTAGVDRLVTWHPHLRQIHGFYGATPVYTLDSLELFVEHFKQFQNRGDVLAFAPDVGASKFVTRFGRALGLPCAIASKVRPRPEEAVISQIIGDTTDKKTAIIVDDMISSGGTMYALVKKLVAEDGIESVYMAASHNLCLPAARERLIELHEKYQLRELVVTNTIPQTSEFTELPFIQVKDISSVLAQLIFRIRHNRPVSDLYSSLGEG